MSATRQLAEALIARPSVTPQDAGCIDLIAARLAPLGFANEIIDSGPADFRVRNLWSKRPAALDGQEPAACTPPLSGSAHRFWHTGRGHQRIDQGDAAAGYVPVRSVRQARKAGRILSLRGPGSVT